MPIFSWLNTYSVNNDEIDEHHRNFFSIVNKLHDVIVGRDTVNNFDDAMYELINYTDYHFRTEEQHMIESDYSNLDNHIIQHRYFSQKIIDFKNLNTNEYVARHELIVFLGEWILHHVVEEDKNIMFDEVGSK